MGNCFCRRRNGDDILANIDNGNSSSIGTGTRTSRNTFEDYYGNRYAAANADTTRNQRILRETQNIPRPFEAPTSRGSSENDLISFQTDIRDIEAATNQTRSLASITRPDSIGPNNKQFDISTSRSTHTYQYGKENKGAQNEIINRASTNKNMENLMSDAFRKQLHRLQSSTRSSKTIIVKNDDILLNLGPVMDIHYVPHLQDNQAYVFEPLDANSERFVRKRLFRNKRFNEKFKIINAVRIWNPYLMLQYELNKKKYEDLLHERHLYHGTGSSSLEGILTHNFDWRKVQEDTFGRGVYFANNPFFASHFSIKHKSPFKMIVAKVLIEIDEYYIRMGKPGMVLPPSGHTATSKNTQEFVKFEDGCFYPEFLVTLKYNT